MDKTMINNFEIHYGFKYTTILPSMKMEHILYTHLDRLHGLQAQMLWLNIII